MKLTEFQRKSVSLVVLFTFLALLHFWATPAPASTGTGNSTATIAPGDGSGPGFFEEESAQAPVIKKSKKFPWLLVGLGAVAVGVALYFLVIKKPNYKLNVSLGVGCTGTPAASASYKKGTVVTYDYKPYAGYGNVQVTVDGAAVPNSGTITMDRDKTLSVSAENLDIRGTWLFSFTGVDGFETFTMICSGSRTSGTWIMVGYSDTGNYTVDGENVAFVFNGTPWTFNGKFETKDQMSGTHVWAAIGVSGTWTAIRQASSTTVDPAGRALHSGPSILLKLLNR